MRSLMVLVLDLIHSLKVMERTRYYRMAERLQLNDFSFPLRMRTSSGSLRAAVFSLTVGRVRETMVFCGSSTFALCSFVRGEIELIY